MEEMILGFLSGQWEGGKIERGGRSRIWSRDVVIVSSVLPWGTG